MHRERKERIYRNPAPVHFVECDVHLHRPSLRSPRRAGPGKKCSRTWVDSTKYPKIGSVDWVSFFQHIIILEKNDSRNTKNLPGECDRHRASPCPEPQRRGPNSALRAGDTLSGEPGTWTRTSPAECVPWFKFKRSQGSSSIYNLNSVCWKL